MTLFKMGPCALNLTPKSGELGMSRLPRTVGRVTAHRRWHARRVFWRLYRVTKDDLL